MTPNLFDLMQRVQLRSGGRVYFWPAPSPVDGSVYWSCAPFRGGAMVPVPTDRGAYVAVGADPAQALERLAERWGVGGA
ncbi:hypothetical protein [Calidithermus chliarophilus]|uniref:hypothetical protein n=2 Tax=Calidithermus TaxID=2747271 RepID=UPI00047F7D45|nr:hypothetical protein [Calidithermus chliarophilus]